jgi:hypothetical protein
VRCAGSRPGPATLLVALGLVLVPWLAWAGGLGTGASESTLTVTWRDARLGVTADGVSRARILEELARQASLEVRGLDALPAEPVTLRLAGLTLEEGLRRLLAGVRAYVLVEEASSDNDHRLVRLVVVSPRAGGAAPATGGPAPEGEMTPVGVPAALTGLEAAAEQGDVETLGTLARELLAGPDRSEALVRLLTVARRPNPPTRLLALQLLHDTRESGATDVLQTVGEATADADPSVKEWAIQALAEWTEPAAARFLRGALRDPDPAVRMQVVESLARTEEGRLLIGEALADEDPAIRAFARFWLEQDAPEGETPPNS